MRYLALFLLLTGISFAQPPPATPSEMRAYVDGILREYDNLGTKPFDTKWTNGAHKESWKKLPDGTWTYTRFYPTGGPAVKYQKGTSKAVNYERFFSNGKTSELLRKDDRFIDFTSYWLNGEKKAKYMYTFASKATSYEAKTQDGKQIWPKAR